MTAAAPPPLGWPRDCAPRSAGLRVLAVHDPKELPMPTVTTPNLTLSESNGIVTMTITFIPTFSTFEKELAALGCTYDAHYTVHGVDNGVPGAELTAVDIPNMAIPVIGLPQPLPVMQQIT